MYLKSKILEKIKQGLGVSRSLPACFKQAQSCKKSYLSFVDCLLKYFLQKYAKFEVFLVLRKTQNFGSIYKTTASQRK